VVLLGFTALEFMEGTTIAAGVPAVFGAGVPVTGVPAFSFCFVFWNDRILTTSVDLGLRPLMKGKEGGDGAGVYWLICSSS
jgi:hypothetical protein